MNKKKVKILLVDDQPANLTALESVLAELDEELVSVGSGEQALRAVLDHSFALVLLDVQMPTMSGFDTAALMRRHPRSQELPIIFLTAASQDAFPVEQAYALGAVDYITKPFNPVVLRARVSVFIDLYRKTAAIALLHHQRHQAALRARDERIRLILDSTRDYAFIGTDAEGVVTEWEGGAFDILGWDAGSARGRSADMIFTHEDRAAGVPRAQRALALETGRATDKRWHVRRDGSRFFAEGVMVPLRDDAGKLRGYAHIFRDATAEKLASEQLAEIEAERERLFRQVEAAGDRLADIFQRAPAFMCVMRGPEHKFEFANQRFMQLVGDRPLLGLTVREALPELEDQGLLEQYGAVYRDGEPVEDRNQRMLLRREGGALEQRFVDAVCIALREADGAISGVLVHGIDVTERTLAGLLAEGQRSALELAVSDAPLGDVLDVLASTAEDFSGGAGMAAIRLADGERGSLRQAAGPTLPQEFLDGLDALPPGVQAGPEALAAASGEVVAVADIGLEQRWPAYRALAQAHGLRSCRSLPILAPSGAVLGVFCWYCRDLREHGEEQQEALALLANTASLVIGQRHEAQERLAAEARSLNILESISEGFLAIGGDWRISYANHAAEQITGAGRQALVGAVLWDAIPELRGGAIEQGLRRSVEQRTHVKFEAYYDPFGRWFEINSCPTPDGGIALYFRDETDRRLAEEGIRRLAAVAEQSPDFIGIATPDSMGMFLNPAGRRLSGIAADAPISNYSLADFFAPESRQFVLDEVLPALTGAPARWEGELRFAHLATGEVAPVYFKGFAVRDDRGEIIGLATVTRDITEQKRAEDELRRVAADLSEADHRKSEFLATLAHELRNPLAPIRTGLDLLRMAPPEPAALTRILGMMDRQLGHLIHLVNDLLDVARITRGKIELKKEPAELKSLVAMALETGAALVEASGHALTVELPADPIMLEVDSTRIVQVLSNLLNNAAKYTPPGGRIAVRAWTEEGQAVVAVSDSGIGIPAEALGTVFDMFTQVRGNIDRAQGGLGIGLSLVRRLAELHGGSVAAASAGRGEGSTFTLRLPLGDSGRAAAGAVADADSPASGLRVLVVDDNADAAESLSALLSMLGHQAEVALDGRSGFEAARRAVPDLVFLDIGMPGMNGHEVARAIRASAGMEQVELVALTGWGAGDDVKRSREAGFDQHLTKPVSIDALERALRAAAGRKK
ncbi:response regulator [Massilia sp. R2A-15]|uniref:response regulator n=1 Tax=Massilia sp. R2A-15 TaxID=3064278 RepID=UPI002736F8F5|nr:response regulator [Massilia sp. R2A-15]WLI91330.1 response regulator [Massilia sp. R2A-15]